MSNNTRLILHVKGTEAETAELPKDVVRAAISQGQITDSQLIWSPAENIWKQVREMPDLLPSQKLAAAPSYPAAVPASKAEDVEAIISESPTSPIARIAAAASAPRIRVASASAEVPPEGKALAVKAVTPAPAPSTRHLKIQEAEDPHWLRWLCIGMGTFILLILGMNYFLVHQPLVSNMGQTPYANVTVYAHYGAFMQPNVMVIHIPVSDAITPDNLTDFLATLAHSTPQNPITGDLFDRVALTSAWTTQYSFSGETWKQFGTMKHEDKGKDDRKDFLIDQMGDSTGQSLVPGSSTLSEESLQARRKQAWAVFAAHFIAGQNTP